MAEERTTEDERFHIMDARRRAAAKRKKLKSLGQGSSIEEEEEEEEPDEAGKFQSVLSNIKVYFSSWFGQVQLKKKRKHQAGRWLENILASREENQASNCIAFSNLSGVL